MRDPDFEQEMWGKSFVDPWRFCWKNPRDISDGRWVWMESGTQKKSEA